jgi:membrane-associated protease RseP (regulator of RpoE activity)
MSTDDQNPPGDAAQPIPAIPQRPRRVLVPVLLFLATCVTTSDAGGPAYAVAVMTILLSHELGHYLQARRYGVPVSLPYFIPIPAKPLGTMGAVIAMQRGVGNRRTIFDIAVTGPLAGLAPALAFSIIGLQWSTIIAAADARGLVSLGEPILFKILAYLVIGPLPDGRELVLHPVAFAGWVGIFITALNLIPIGQLDGGHILYALLVRRAHVIARIVLLAAMAAVVLGGYWTWILMIFLLMLMGPDHPPTADDTAPLGLGRTILGWLILPFVALGFTPVPFSFGM